MMASKKLSDNNHVHNLQLPKQFLAERRICCTSKHRSIWSAAECCGGWHSS